MGLRSSADTAALVEAARATAGFPGAFPPVSEESLMANRVLPKLIHDDRTSCVMDGGVLDNAPFLPVLESITERRLDAPVRERVVVFIVPSSGRLRDRASRLPCEQRRWPGVAASALRYPTEGDFRSHVEELDARLKTTIRDTQFDLFSHARAVLFAVRRRIADTESVTPLVAAPETGITEIDRILAGQAPNWLPPAGSCKPAGSREVWRWGLITCERVLQCLASDLHELYGDHRDLPPERRERLIHGAACITDLLNRTLAVFDAVDAHLQVLKPLGGGVSDDVAADLLQQAFDDLQVPTQLASIVRRAVAAHVSALRGARVDRWRPQDVLETCLAAVPEPWRRKSGLGRLPGRPAHRAETYEERRAPDVGRVAAGLRGRRRRRDLWPGLTRRRTESGSMSFPDSRCSLSDQPCPGAWRAQGAVPTAAVQVQDGRGVAGVGTVAALGESFDHREQLVGVLIPYLVKHDQGELEADTAIDGPLDGQVESHGPLALDGGSASEDA
ncbi:patatin-like phospholipase family protein [Streptomyces yokosukanensis]|uniref:patatin-like phospholipase family protein n=1 Tax=Streptomyces yokosukanensis TaxID=67386 RepID=UPI00099EC994|nr:patatin-like phospholipase family protein [Streptomyces yokosukanensis]